MLHMNFFSISLGIRDTAKLKKVLNRGKIPWLKTAAALADWEASSPGQWRIIYTTFLLFSLTFSDSKILEVLGV